MEKTDWGDSLRPQKFTARPTFLTRLKYRRLSPLGIGIQSGPGETTQLAGWTGFCFRLLANRAGSLRDISAAGSLAFTASTSPLRKVAAHEICVWAVVLPVWPGTRHDTLASSIPLLRGENPLPIARPTYNPILRLYGGASEALGSSRFESAGCAGRA